MKYLMLALTLCLAGCSSSTKKTTRILTQQGYSEIELTGYKWFTCGEHETFSSGFKAVSQSGAHVTGAVCSGLFGGSVVRLD